MISYWHYNRLHVNGLHKPNITCIKSRFVSQTGVETCTWGLHWKNSSFGVNSSESLQTSAFIYRRVDALRETPPVSAGETQTDTQQRSEKHLHCWQCLLEKLTDRYTAAFRENRAETRRNWHRTSSFSGNISVYVDFSSFTNPKLCISLHCRTQKNNTRFTFMHLADAFIQSDLQYIQVIHCLSVYVFPGNWTHNLCAANAMLYHWTTATLKHYFIIWWWHDDKLSCLGEVSYSYHIHRSWLDIVKTNDWNNINITNITLTSMFRTC